MATQQIVPSEQHNSAVVVPITKQAPKQITQFELETVFFLRKKQDELEALEKDLKARLQAGASVEDGVHVAELKNSSRRNVAWREVAERLGDRLYGEGKGAPYCEKVLNSTKPTPCVSLDIH